MKKIFRTYLNICDRLAKPMAMIILAAIIIVYIAVIIRCFREGPAFTKHILSETWTTLKSVLHV